MTSSTERPSIRERAASWRRARTLQARDEALAKQERIDVRSGGNEYAVAEDERRGMRPEARTTFVLGCVFVFIVLLAFIVPTYIFEHSMHAATLSTMLDSMSSNLDNLIGVLTGNGDAGEQRFCAVIVCAVSGAALGMCGSTYQGAFNNPLAAPKTLGVMAGGALGGLVFVLFLQDSGAQIPFEGSYTNEQYQGWLASLTPLEWLWFQYGKCVCSMVGCFVVVGIVVGLTAWLGKGKLTNVVVIIFGQVFAATVTALISFARYYYTANGGIDMIDELKAIENYTMIYNYGFTDLKIIVIPILVCMVIILVMSRRLTLLSFGDDEAATMGINVNATRYAMIVVCTIMVAVSISFCGHVSYLGFISAQISRRLVGSDFRYLLPASFFVGGSFLTVIQWICQSGLPYTDSYAAGTVCSVLGATLFVFIVLAQRGKGDSGVWR